MKVERALKLNRRELANMLRDWADKLDGGIPLDLAGMGVIVPEEFSAELAYKEKNSKAKVKLKISWPQTNHEDERRTLPEHRKTDIKWIKTEMGEVLTDLRRGLESASGVAVRDVQRFRELSALFLERAKPAWRPGAAEVVAAADVLVAAVEEGNREGVRQRIESLVQQRRSCHDSFK